MSHLSRGVLAALLVTSACSNPKPPQGSAPADPAAIAAEPAATPDAGVTPREPGATTAGAAVLVQKLVQTLFVRERRADCVGEGPRKCLQVREAESGEWRNLYAAIEGFAYEDGHAYELRVEVTEIPHPQADGPSLRYRLLEVVSKRKIALPNAG